jgi:trehalose/maltose hydrolase-like predicted phosphorylase
VSIGARGLTSPTYEGHVFWDTAIYLLPFYSFTWPAAARAIVMYRYRTLDAARAKAARLGWRGAFYAWESADTGDEVAPERSRDAKGAQVPICSGRDEAHVSADVAYAAWRYWRATGDDDFLLEAGAEILLETARFWASRAERDAGGCWHIRHVEGPDEYHQDVDDNAFTNAMARWNLQRGIEIAELVPARWPTRWPAISSKISLDDQELRVWGEAAAGLESCFDARRGLYEQFAGYFDLEPIDPRPYTDGEAPIDVTLGPERVQNSQVIKQADVVEMLALLPGDPPDVVGANFDYYEARCAHGSSLSVATHALAAARLGRADQALALFHQAVETDLGAPSHLSCGGVRFAALGGLWQTAVFGFAGVREDRDGLRFEPHLPTRWRRLAFRLQWRRRTLQVCIEPGGVSVSLEAGEPLEVAIGGERRTVGRNEPARFETRALSGP